MHFFEFMTAAMAFSTAGFIVHSFFSYLKFRRTNAVGGGKSKDYEELAEAFQHYIRKTNKRIEHLEAITTHPDELLEGKNAKAPLLDELESNGVSDSEFSGLKNRLENR